MATIDPKYATTVTATGGREGHAVSDDGVLDVQLRRPKPNGVAEGTNPEQLFAAAWAACFQGALLATARDRGITLPDSTVAVEVAMGPEASGAYGLAAKIAVDLPGMAPAEAEELVAAAHQRCPYSRATRGNVEVELTART